MTRTHQITALALVALAFVGIARHHGTADPHRHSTEIDITESVTGGPTEKQSVELSEHGLAAVNDAGLARVAINDGRVESAKKFLAQIRALLDRIRKDDPPITVTMDVKQGRTPIEHRRTHEVLDLIPIMSDLQVVEGFAAPQDSPASAPTQDGKASGGPIPSVAPATAEQKTQGADTDAARVAARETAIMQAKEHLRQGDQQAAAKALQLADLMLITRQVNMPLAETTRHVDKASHLVDRGKLHDANLELKKVQDGLVITTTVVAVPVTDADGAASGAGASNAG